MEASSPRGGAPAKKGVHIMVKLPSGTEVHEFILPVGYTVDQVKEEILNVEFSKLQNLDTVKDAADADTPLELSILSTKMGTVRARGLDSADAPSNLPRQRNGPHSVNETEPSAHSPRESPSDVSAGQKATNQAHRFTSPPRSAAPSSRAFSSRPPLSPRTTSSPSLVTTMLGGHISPRDSARAASAASQPVTGKEPKEETAHVEPPRLPLPALASPVREDHDLSVATSSSNVDNGGSEEALLLLQAQLQRAQADVARLTAKLTRIGRLARLELLPLAATTPLTVGLSPPPETPAVRESDIIASEKRLRSTLALVLAEIERGGEDAAIKAAIEDQVTNQLYLTGATDLASAALTKSIKEPRVRSERASTSAGADLPFDDKRKRSLSANRNNFNAIAGRMNLDVPSSVSLGSSSSSPSNMSGVGSGSLNVSPLPPRKTLTPEERTEMLQQEFFDTEETYLRSLQKLHDYFEVPLESSGLLTPEQCDTLFSRVRKQLLEIHKHLLQTIKERPVGTSFSDSLLTIAPYLKLYTEYVNNHPQAISLLIDLNATSKKFSTFLKQLEQKTEVESQDLSSYLIRPIQRLPRYEMLLRDMVKYTTEETEHLKLSRLLESVKKVNEHLNEAKRKRDNSTKMATIQSNLILGKAKGQFSLFSSQMRNFVREDMLLVKKVKKEKTTFTKHHFFLFNDILLNTVKNREGKFKLHHVYQLGETSFQKYEGESDTVALFRISSPESAVEDLAKAIHVKADPGGDIDGWLRDVLAAKSSLRSSSTTTTTETEESKEGRYHVTL